MVAARDQPPVKPTDQRAQTRWLSQAESLFCRGSLLTWRRSSSAGPAGPKAQLIEGWLRHSVFPTLIGHSMI